MAEAATPVQIQAATPSHSRNESTGSKPLPPGFTLFCVFLASKQAASAHEEVPCITRDNALEEAKRYKDDNEGDEMKIPPPTQVTATLTKKYKGTKYFTSAGPNQYKLTQKGKDTIPRAQSSYNLSVDSLNDFMQSHFRTCFSQTDKVPAGTEITDLQFLKNCFAKAAPAPLSGCWISPSSESHYKTVWEIYAKFSPRFHHLEAEVDHGQGPQRLTNPLVRHHPRCELLLLHAHNHCCRPSHLCHGSSAMNDADIRIRQQIQNSPEYQALCNSFNTQMSVIIANTFKRVFDADVTVRNLAQQLEAAAHVEDSATADQA